MYFTCVMIKPTAWCPPSLEKAQPLSCQPPSTGALPLTEMKVQRVQRTAVLQSIASMYKIDLFTPLFVLQMLSLWFSHKEKIPNEKNIYISRIGNKLEPTLISIAGTGRG